MAIAIELATAVQGGVAGSSLSGALGVDIAVQIGVGRVL